MLAGCLPLLLQWPFLSVMYLLFRSSVVGGAPNTLLAHYLFGAHLGSHWLAGTGPLSAHGAVFAALFLLLVVIGWLAARAARRFNAPASPAQPARRPALGGEPAALPDCRLRRLSAACRPVPVHHDRMDAARARRAPAGSAGGGCRPTPDGGGVPGAGVPGARQASDDGRAAGDGRVPRNTNALAAGQRLAAGQSAQRRRADPANPSPRG